MDALKKKIDELLMQKDIVIVAIDGKCTSGKTTLATKLAEIYDCNVFHILINAIIPVVMPATMLMLKIQ